MQNSSLTSQSSSSLYSQLLPLDQQQASFSHLPGSFVRPPRKMQLPMDHSGRILKASSYFGVNLFNLKNASQIPENIREELLQIQQSERVLPKEYAEVVAQAITQWATDKGATHFCHWFQPLNGTTAEKQDAFLHFTAEGIPIEKLSGSQLSQGEPDASSFPNGGSRSTFEARGYTSWDMTSSIFLVEGTNGLTVCIPTAFVSYTGESLDVKTPLLRSLSGLNQSALKFFHSLGFQDIEQVIPSCGAEQEYFLVDRDLYYSRPDLVMTSRSLFGEMSEKNQQMEDHYFGPIPERILAFMQELDYELIRLGIPSKTRHNEVAPGQFEIAPLFTDANVSVDQNLMMMYYIKKVAERHHLVPLLHEKPFQGINGSGKHVNWSLRDQRGKNLLDPGEDPSQNELFLALCAVVIRAVYKRGDALRMSIASHSNDHRLGANEAPPSIISIYLGETLENIFKSVSEGKILSTAHKEFLLTGAQQLARLQKDNTDRNRTSPFAFIGNRFEFRAVGSSQNIGWPLTILHGAMIEAFEEAVTIMNSASSILPTDRITHYIQNVMKTSSSIIFGGDGYSQEWRDEANKRSLPNYKDTPEAYSIVNKGGLDFLSQFQILSPSEIELRANIGLERYILCREIEAKTLIKIFKTYIAPAIMHFKGILGHEMITLEKLKMCIEVEQEFLKVISQHFKNAYFKVEQLQKFIDEHAHHGDIQLQERAELFAREGLVLIEEISQDLTSLEKWSPIQIWPLPKAYHLLFLR